MQIQILLLRELQREMALAVVFVTHDFGAALYRQVADRIAVMYAGRCPYATMHCRDTAPEAVRLAPDHGARGLRTGATAA